jgi:uncharacterized membrane protein
MRKSFITGEPVSTGSSPGQKHRIIHLASVLAFSFSLSCIYMAMRGVMRLGGFVASGGPYHIAHQAPDWVWIFPLSIFLMMGAMFTSFAESSKIGGPNLMALSWSALFLALGWNFTEFGFGIGSGGGLAWGWVICSVLFILMGLLPMIFVLKAFFKSLRERTDRDREEGSSWTVSLLVQFAAAAAGTLLGLSFFRMIAI